MAATTMTWFSRGIPFGIGQSRRKWNILNTSIKTWMANLSIGDEDNCCQRSSFDHSVSIGPGTLLSSPPRDFKQYWIWPSLRSERKSSKRVRFESDYPSMDFVRGIHRWQRTRNAENVCIWWRHHDRTQQGEYYVAHFVFRKWTNRVFSRELWAECVKWNPTAVDDMDSSQSNWSIIQI